MNNELELSHELGQVLTPQDLAEEMVRLAREHSAKIEKVLDPSCGPATFSVALNKVLGDSFKVDCFDIDHRMCNLTKEIHCRLNLEGSRVVNADFLLLGQNELQDYDLVIMNPPYIRQELISKRNKDIYRKNILSNTEFKIDRRSNLYIYFLLKSCLALRKGGIMCAIVYDSLRYTYYGTLAMEFLRQNGTVVQSVNVQMPFEGVLIDAEILVFVKGQPSTLLVGMTESNNSLVALSNLVNCRRGTALPNRSVYIANKNDAAIAYSEPFFLRQKSLSGCLIKADERAYLKSSFSIDEPGMIDFLKDKANQLGKKVSISQPTHVVAPIAFNYYIRNKPRFLFNGEMIPFSDNFISVTPKGSFPVLAAWLLLNSSVFIDSLMKEARTQGNGLKKLQVFEFKRAKVPNWALLPTSLISILEQSALKLIHDDADFDRVRSVADELTKDFFDDAPNYTSKKRSRE